MKSSREILIEQHKQARRRFGRPLASVDSKAAIMSVAEQMRRQFNVAVQNVLIQFSRNFDKGIRDAVSDKSARVV